MTVTAHSALKISTIRLHYHHSTTMLSSSHQVIFWMCSKAEGVCIVHALVWIIYKFDKDSATFFYCKAISACTHQEVQLKLIQSKVSILGKMKDFYLLRHSNLGDKQLANLGNCNLWLFM